MTKMNPMARAYYTALMTEVLSYGNAAYLRKTGRSSFDKVRGTRLWELWYGKNATDFSVRTMEDNYKKAIRGEKSMLVFSEELNQLLSDLREEFKKL